MAMSQQQFPPLPEIGRPDVYYTRGIMLAEQEGDLHKRAALKVGRYITFAMKPDIPWEEKKKYFLHALKHHCSPPTLDEETQHYYDQLARLVREHAGAEALRLACIEDDMYAARKALGQDISQIEDDAEQFFLNLLGPGDHCPEYFDEADWAQLKMIRDQWI